MKLAVIILKVPHVCTFRVMCECISSSDFSIMVHGATCPMISGAAPTICQNNGKVKKRNQGFKKFLILPVKTTGGIHGEIDKVLIN